MDTSISNDPRYTAVLIDLEDVFTQGIFVWLLQDDSRVVMEKALYEKMLVEKAVEFLYPNMSNQYSSLAPDAY